MIAVAIDGPAGAGKSTIARKAASELSYIYVDKGAIYRAVGLACTQKKIDPSDSEKVVEMLPETEISIVFFNGEQHVLLDDKDVSSEIRTEKASMTASKVSAIPEVRKFLLDLQRNFAKNDNVVMDGRDIGTVVLPNAQVKIFLTASPETRAKRRVLQLKEKGETADYNTVLADIIQRDYDDSHREIAPLKAADSAVMVDTSELTLEQSIAKIISIIKEHIE